MQSLPTRRGDRRAILHCDIDPCRNANGCHVLEYRQRLMETSLRWQSKREYVEFCQGSVA